MDDIDIYRQSALILYRKTPAKIYSWITIIILSFILMGLIITCFRYDKYVMYEAVIQDKVMELHVDKAFFNISESKLKIKDNSYTYKVNTVEPYVYQDNEIAYWRVTISASLPKDWIIDNNYMQVYFNKGKTTFLKEIVKFIKKGMIK